MCCLLEYWLIPLDRTGAKKKYLQAALQTTRHRLKIRVQEATKMCTLQKKETQAK